MLVPAPLGTRLAASAAAIWRRSRFLPFTPATTLITGRSLINLVTWPMAEDHIRYDILAQEALRGVMRKVLAEVAKTGLPGNHHFFITFMTGAPGVRISTRLRERYPEQMTIVIQFQYWDLKVSEVGFEIGLSFSETPEKLEIPFSAVRGFYDPSVNFELEFDVKSEDMQAAPASVPAFAVVTADSKKPASDAASPASEDDTAAAKSAEVVSLDAFRKK